MKRMLSIIAASLLISSTAIAQPLVDVSLHGTVFGYLGGDTTSLAVAGVRITHVTTAPQNSVRSRWFADALISGLLFVIGSS
jgi:hypothetical protein